MTRLDIRALNSSIPQAALFHQGVNRDFFVEGKQYLSKFHGSCPLQRISSTD